MSGRDGDILPVGDAELVIDRGSEAPGSAWNGRKTRRNHWTCATPDQTPPYPPHKPMGYLKESRLIARAQQGDVAARNELWETHVRLAVSAVNQFAIPKALLHDIVQESAVGLHRAIAKFEVERLHAFSTYAWWWVSQYAQRAIPYHIYPIKVPSPHLADLQRFRRWWETVDCFGQRGPLPAKHRDRLMALRQKLLRIYRCCFPESLGEARPVIREETDPVTNLWRSERAAIVHAALAQLDPRDRSILLARHGLDGGPEQTLEEIAAAMGLTRERIRQLQIKAEERLRRILQQWPKADREPSAAFVQDLFD